MGGWCDAAVQTYSTTVSSASDTWELSIHHAHDRMQQDASCRLLRSSRFFSVLFHRHVVVTYLKVKVVLAKAAAASVLRAGYVHGGGSSSSSSSSANDERRVYRTSEGVRH